VGLSGKTGRHFFPSALPFLSCDLIGQHFISS
jgi:hypothetical protein